jgi:HK97 family phage major capsid protein
MEHSSTEFEIIKKALADHGMSVKSFMEKFDNEKAELKARVLDLEQSGARRPTGGFGGGSGIAELADAILHSGGATAFAQKSTPSFSVEVPTRLLTKNTIINASGSGQPLVASDRADARGVVFAPQRRLTVRGLFEQIPTDSNLIERPAESAFTNNATEQGGPTSPVGNGEGELKAESALTFTLQQTPVVTLAHFIVASRQILSDAPLLQRHLEQRLIYGLNLKEETAMLTDTGTAGNMIGIIAKATAFTGGATNQTRLDTLAKAANQLAVGNYEPSAFILHPTDWLACQLLKDTTGQYILGDPGAAATPMLWGRPVIATPSQPIGTFVCIDAQRYGYIADREVATVRISENVGDAFLRNLIHVLVESRVALVTELGAAAVTGSLDYAG